VLAVCSTAAWAGGDDEDLVADVIVKGNQILSKQAVLHHVRTRVGQPYDQRIVNEDEKRLLQTGRFKSVRTFAKRTADGVVLTFEVVENPTIESIQFLNNKAFSDEKLLAELPYGPGDPFSQFTVEAGRKAILKKYLDKGHQFVEIKVIARDRKIVYEIVEGPKVAVRAVKFEGNTHFNSLTLKLRIGTNAAFWPMVKNELSLEQVDQDVNTLRNMYVDEGYLGAEVSRRLEYNEAKSQVTVVYVIAEHERYRINEILFEGNVAFSDQQLLERIQLSQGKFLVAAARRQDAQRIQDAYGRVGYIEAAVVPDIEYVDPEAPLPPWAQPLPDPTPALVNLVFRITESDQYRIGRIDIRGNTVTQERVIRRELRFYPEKVYDTVAVDRARQRLLDSRLFSKVNMIPVGKTGRTRDILIEVTEARTAEFLIGVGVSTNSGLLGNISFTQRNFDLFGWPRAGRKSPAFKGAGQRFSIVAEPGTELMRFNIEWFEPYLMDQPYSLGVKGYLFTRGRDTYDETRAGPVVSVGHRFRNGWYGEVATRLEMVDINDLDSDAPPEVVADKGTHFLVGAKGTLVKDRTDSRWMPTTGDRFRFSYEQVMGDYTFGRLEGDYRIYRTVHLDALDRKHVIAGRVMIGQIFGDAPVFEKYYGGGIGSIRGFEYRGVSPRSKGTTKRIGGDFVILTGAEYQYPIYGKYLRGVAFVDAGTVEADTGLNDYRVTVGAGLRWTVPMMGPVPISLDFAVPVMKNSDDDEQLISFFLGWTF
jgi:outer membrane protein insertion porin family